MNGGDDDDNDEALCLSRDPDDHLNEDYAQIITSDECHDEFYYEIGSKNVIVGKDSFKL